MHCGAYQTAVLHEWHHKAALEEPHAAAPKPQVADSCSYERRGKMVVDTF